jgi:hypothetical protein
VVVVLPTVDQHAVARSARTTFGDGDHCHSVALYICAGRTCLRVELGASVVSAPAQRTERTVLNERD